MLELAYSCSATLFISEPGLVNAFAPWSYSKDARVRLTDGKGRIDFPASCHRCTPVASKECICPLPRGGRLIKKAWILMRFHGCMQQDDRFCAFLCSVCCRLGIMGWLSRAEGAGRVMARWRWAFWHLIWEISKEGSSLFAYQGS